MVCFGFLSLICYRYMIYCGVRICLLTFYFLLFYVIGVILLGFVRVTVGFRILSQNISI